jgi:hypothetical protein
METVRQEHCPQCDGTSTGNYLYVRPGKPILVYVRCLKCKCYVCRYTLSRYTSDKPYDALLQMLGQGEADGSSGRELKRRIESFTFEVKAEYDKVMELARREDSRLMEQIIAEERPDTGGGI